MGMTTGQRTAEEIRRRAYPELVGKELRILDISPDCYSRWKRGLVNPDAWALEKLARNGYDVVYLLSGRPAGVPAYPVLCGCCARSEKETGEGITYCRLLKRYMPENGYCSFGKPEQPETENT